MSDSTTMERLFNEWKAHEAAIEAIEAEMAQHLGLTPPPQGRLPVQTGAPPTKPKKYSPAIKLGGPAGDGTKGRRVLEALYRLGGSAGRSDIAAAASMKKENAGALLSNLG